MRCMKLFQVSQEVNQVFVFYLQSVQTERIREASSRAATTTSTSLVCKYALNLELH